MLILTTFDLDEYVYDALRAGASGFLLKDAGPDQFTSVRVVAAGEALLAPSVTRRLIDDCRGGRRRVRDPPGLDALTPRELEVLCRRAGLSNREIAERLTVDDDGQDARPRLLAKLDLRDRLQPVVLAYESGLVHGA